MTVRDKLENMLVVNGMFQSQAKEVIDLAIPVIDKEMSDSEVTQGYKLTYDRPASEYPPILYSFLFEKIKPVALKWIDKNKPKAWFREIFVEN